MSEYVLILLWIGLCALFAKYIKLTKTEMVCGVEEERYPWLFAFIAFLPIILMVGFRDQWFMDTSLYVSDYQTIPNSLHELPSFLSTVSKDKGFTVLSVLIKSIFGSDFRVYLLILALLHGTIVTSFFRKYSINYIFSVFLFVASSDYISWMFNGIRQFTAVVIILCATPFLLKKKWVVSILLILLAATMHQSALLMIPIIFIVQGKAWNKKTLLFIVLVLVVILFIDSFTSFLDDSMQNTQYSNVVKDYTEWKDDGTNPIRVLVYSIPTIIALIGKKRIEESNSILINMCVNMSIVSTGLFVVSMFTSGIFMGRLPIYCSLFGFILLPWEIDNIFDIKIKRILYLIAVILFLLFYFYQLHFIWALV